MPITKFRKQTKDYLTVKDKLIELGKEEKLQELHSPKDLSSSS